MEIVKHILEENKPVYYSEDIDFSNEKLDEILIRKIKNCHAEVNVTNLFFGHYRVVINIKADVVLPCAYTLEDVDYIIKGNEEYIFVEDENELDSDGYMVYEPGDVIDLNPYIFSLLIALVPFKVVKEGATLPKGDSGFRVMSEDEYCAEKKAKGDPRWAALDDLEFDDD